MLVISQVQLTTAKNNPVTLPAGNTSVIVPIPVNRHGHIYRVLAKQASGPSVAFTLNLLDEDVSLSGAPPLEVCRIIPEQSVSAGGALYYNSEHGIAYRNKSNQDYVYLRISISTAQGSNCVFDVTITWSPVSA